MRLLLNTRTPWSEPPRARHQLAGALSDQHMVYFVSANEVGPPHLEVGEVSKNLTLITPTWPIPKRERYRTPGVNETYQQWLFREVKQLIDPDIVINFDHTATELSQFFRHQIYYCNDYHIRNYGRPFIKRYMERCEAQVAQQSLFCVSTCRYLRNHLAQFNSRSVEIRLGAPQVEAPTVFRRNKQRIQLALVDFTRPRKTPFDLLKRIDRDPQFEVSLYGPLEEQSKCWIREHTKIDLKGVCRGHALVDELRTKDVGLAIYRTDDDNPGRTPNKLWLYLAAGIPCVTTDLPAIQRWSFDPGFVYRAPNSPHFPKAITQAYEENSEDLMLRRHKYSQQNTWDHRARELLDHMTSHI